MKIHTIGWYGHNNVGDESYKLSFPFLFPEHTFTFSESIEPADVYFLGGGDVVYGSYLKRLIDVPNKHIMSTTLSNIVDLKGFKSIAVRDLKSIEMAKKCDVTAILIPDFAFALTPNVEHGKTLIKNIFDTEKAEKYDKVVAVTINGFLLPHETSTHRDAVNFQTLTYELSRCMDNTCCSFICLPFGTAMPTDDRVSNSWISSKCKYWKKTVSVWDRLSVQDTLDILSACDGVVSTRLHSSIFSCVAGVPFIDITHNHKNESFLDTIGFRKYDIPYCGFSSTQFMKNISLILDGDPVSRKELNDITSKYKNELLLFSKDMKVLLEG